MCEFVEKPWNNPHEGFNACMWVHSTLWSRHVTHRASIKNTFLLDLNDSVVSEEIHVLMLTWSTAFDINSLLCSSLLCGEVQSRQFLLPRQFRKAILPCTVINLSHGLSLTGQQIFKVIAQRKTHLSVSNVSQMLSLILSVICVVAKPCVIRLCAQQKLWCTF